LRRVATRDLAGGRIIAILVLPGELGRRRGALPGDTTHVPVGAADTPVGVAITRPAEAGALE
jgi:hypothetical protein